MLEVTERAMERKRKQNGLARTHSSLCRQPANVVALAGKKTTARPRRLWVYVKKMANSERTKISRTGRGWRSCIGERLRRRNMLSSA